MSASHQDRVVDQFTKLAGAFATAAQFTDVQALDLLLEKTHASAKDTSLDVACGAGVVACHFARVVALARGIDVTPAMLAKARERQAQAGLPNIEWDLGDAACLPYADASFSIVTSRYALHHMASPAAVLREMARVCQPGGRIAVADICLPDDAAGAEAFNRIERLNDPSHVRALTASEWLSAFADAGWPAPSAARYRLEFPLAGMLRASGMASESIAMVEAEVRSAVAAEQLQGCARLEGDRWVFGYTIAVWSASKP